MVNRLKPIALLVLGALSLAAAASSETKDESVQLAGLVSDELGQPLMGATVSVFGKNLVHGAVTAVTDESGRFVVPGVPPGTYRLRAYLAGFFPSAFAKILVEEGAELGGSVLMSLSRLEASERYAEPYEEDRGIAELRWIVQHQDRNILKDDKTAIAVADVGYWDSQESSGFDPEFAVSGEFGVRAATYDEGIDEFPGAGAGLDARLAYARLFIPRSDDGHWLVSAQVLESALSSWAGRAEYVSGDLGGHRLTTGVSYGNFLYGDLGEFRPPEAALVRSLAGDRSAEWFGSVYGSDEFLVGSASIEAGLAFQYFDYLDGAKYATPRFAVAYPLGSGERTVLKGSVDYRVLAPGGEDIGLLSRVAYDDVYGPSRSPRMLRAQKTARFGVGVEHHLSTGTRMAVRVFQENSSDQLVKAFLKGEHAGSAGHFVVGNEGDFQTRGFGVALSQAVGPMVGSVGYTFGSAKPIGLAAPDAEEQEIHDVTTTVATSIDRTRTRLQAAYRVISHPGFSPRGDKLLQGSVDSRFSFQVFQLLPFVGWNGTNWELMVAVRNLFYDDIESASFLDELAVIDAPRRVLGGLTVRF
jgi:hypothetical protein